MISRALLAVLLAAACTACAADAARPAPPAVPSAFTHRGADGEAGWPAADVLHQFGSSELDELIARTEAQSTDLAAATARVRQAIARSRQAHAATLPTLDAGAGALGYDGGARGRSGHEIDWAALLTVSYEVDFWGKNRAAGEAARALEAASRAELATVRITTVSDVAALYFDLLAVREQLQIAEADRDLAQRLLALVQARHDGGLLSVADLAAQRAVLANAEIAIPEWRQREVEILDALAVLVGEPPEGFAVQARTLAGLREPAIGAGLPSQLLLRRPDVIAAEDRLAAAHADLRAARAALLPTLDLSLSGGVQNPAVQAAVLVLPGAGYSRVAGAALTQSLFAGGRRRAVVAEADARREELVNDYRHALLTALSESEDALARIQGLDLQRSAQAEHVAQSELALKAAELRYERGSGPFRAVLDAELARNAAREQATRYTLDRLQALVTLSKALGGGWQSA